jgi:hypothetical protein
MNQTGHPGVYLMFCTLDGLEHPKHAAISEVVCDGECASFIYTADPISVNVVAPIIRPGSVSILESGICW